MDPLDVVSAPFQGVRIAEVLFVVASAGETVFARVVGRASSLAERPRDAVVRARRLLVPRVVGSSRITGRTVVGREACAVEGGAQGLSLGVGLDAASRTRDEGGRRTLLEAGGGPRVGGGGRGVLERRVVVAVHLLEALDRDARAVDLPVTSLQPQILLLVDREGTHHEECQKDASPYSPQENQEQRIGLI